MTTELVAKVADQRQRAALEPKQSDLSQGRTDERVPPEEECLGDVRQTLNLTSGTAPSERVPEDLLNISDEDSGGQQLDTAISSFLKRVSVNLNSPGNSVEVAKIRPRLAPLPPEKTCETEPWAPRHAAETADVLDQLRDVARMSADEAIGVHSLNQMIAQAKRRMWIASLSILATCGLLQVPWEQRPELNIAIAITFSVAAASTLSYFIVTGRLHRKLTTYRFKTSAERYSRFQ